MLKPKISLIALACLAATSTAYAQTSTNNSDNDLTRIVITAKGQQSEAELAAVSHIITADDIERIQANDLSELLQATSGISITRNGGRGAVSTTFVRGAASTQTVVLVDGIRVGSATLGLTELGHIPLESIDRIEVVKGPLSGLYGADAIGGVIQIFTKDGTTDSRYVTVEAGSFGHQRVAAGFSQKGFNVSFSKESNDGIDATTVTSGGNDDEDGFDETSINLSGTIQLNEKSQIKINALHTDNDIEFDNTFGTDTGFESNNQVSSVSATYAQQFAKLNWTSTLGFSTNDSETPAFFSEVDTERVSLSSQADIALNNRVKLIVGADYRDEKVDGSTNFDVADRDNTGLFAQYQLNAGKAGYVANLRFDDNSAYGSDTNGSVAMNYALNDGLRLTASYGTAFRAPSFNQLYFPGFSNPNLEPEESKTAEIGLRGNTKSSQWRVSLFDTQIDNLIESPAPNFLPLNTAKSSLQGVELEYGTNFGGWYINTALDLLDATNDITGAELIRRPEKVLRLSADRSFNQFQVGADLIAEQGRFDRGQELDSWERIDLRGSYNINSKFKVSAKISNLFDEDYELATGFNTEGRAIQVSGKYNF